MNENKTGYSEAYDHDIKPWAYNFWKFMQVKHGLTLHELDILEIMHQVAKINQPEPSADLWSNAPDWAMWAAMDKDKQWYIFEFEPVHEVSHDHQNIWNNPRTPQGFNRAMRITPNPPPSSNWRDSLTRRPGA